MCLNRYYIGWSDDPLEIIEDIYGNAIPEMMGEESKDQSTIYPTLSMSVRRPRKSNCYCTIRVAVEMFDQ